MNNTAGPQNPHGRLLHPSGAGYFEDEEMDIDTGPTSGPSELEDASDSRMPATYFNELQRPTNQGLEPQVEISRRGNVSTGPSVDTMAQKPRGPNGLGSQICTLLESLHARITVLEAKTQIMVSRQCKTVI
jgi:hypothetical protein